MQRAVGWVVADWGMLDQLVLLRAATAAGYRKALLQVIPDRHGRETFEVFRFVRDK